MIMYEGYRKKRKKDVSYVKISGPACAARPPCPMSSAVECRRSESGLVGAEEVSTVACSSSWAY
jgi:hypothetical protein